MGDHIRERRLDLGLLQREAAARIGADEATVNNWEKGNTAPSLRFIPAVIAFLGYDPTPEAAEAALGARIAARRRVAGNLARGACRAGRGRPGNALGGGETRSTRRVKTLLERWLLES